MPTFCLSHEKSPFILLGQCGCVGRCTCAFKAPAQECNLPTGRRDLPRLANRASTLPPVAPCPPSLSPPSAASSLFADAVGLQPDARGVATSLGLNERLFVVNPQEVHELVGTGRAPGPREELCLGSDRSGCGGQSQREGRGAWLWLLLGLRGEEEGVGLS